MTSTAERLARVQLALDKTLDRHDKAVRAVDKLAWLKVASELLSMERQLQDLQAHRLTIPTEARIAQAFLDGRASAGERLDAGEGEH